MKRVISLLVLSIVLVTAAPHVSPVHGCAIVRSKTREQRHSVEGSGKTLERSVNDGSAPRRYVGYAGNGRRFRQAALKAGHAVVATRPAR